jgi:LuxR family transcriptional regulator, maltose regulon positive regulatory protein
MARTTSRVDGDRLVLASKEESPIVVGSSAWFAWLESATTFAFTCAAGKFTARKEARSRGGMYWKAYQTTHGALHRAYLGKTADLTLRLLTDAAVRLTTASVSRGSPPPPMLPPRAAAPAASRSHAVPPPHLLSIKLNIPPARAQLVSRPRLFERLEAGLRGKLTLIAAPAGFGKTTLLSAWRTTEAGSAIPFAWVSLDSRDNDPLLFWRYVLTAIDGVAPSAAAPALALLHSPQAPPSETVLTVLLNEIATSATIPDRFVLVLDDYHVIDAPAVGQALAFLLEHLPPQMRVVITTREDPRLPLARFRARDELTELRAIDLRFTAAEAAEFLNSAMGLSLSPDDLAALEDRTEGWIAGLQLAALALRGRDDRAGFIRTFTGSSRFIIDYLAEEVLERQPDEVRAFLLRTSILERMCAPLCDEVLYGNRNGDSELVALPGAEAPRLRRHSTAPGSSQEMLERLERSNLFIVPLDNERRWYRYHHLFADLLKQRLQQRPPEGAADGRESVAELHSRASQWYEDNGLEIEAFHHAAAAKNVERAARLLEGEAVPLHFRGRGAAELNWLASMPPAVLDAKPTLWWRYASLLLVRGQTTGVEEKLQAAESALQGIEPDDKTPHLVGQIAAARAVLALYRYEVEATLAQSLRALELLSPNNLALLATAKWTLGSAYQRQGDRAAAHRAFTESLSLSQTSSHIFTAIMASIGLAELQIAENQLHLAAETYRHAILLAGTAPQAVVREAHLGLARISYQWNDLETAQEHGGQALRLAQQMDSADTVAACGVFFAHLKLARGDARGAFALLEEAEQYARGHHFAHCLPDVMAARALTLLRQGNLEAAAQLAQANGHLIIQARVHLARGDAATALATLEPVRHEAEVKGWEDERLGVMVVEALALNAQGQTDTAVQRLGAALALAQPGGFIRVFVDEGTAMARLLCEAATRGVMANYTGRLLEVFEAEKPEKPEREDRSHLPAGAAPTPGAPGRRRIEPLSRRELEVLQLMAQGLSNQDVSQRLFLALSTVKGHNRVIFGKLQVQRRTEAVARARELGLLDL